MTTTSQQSPPSEPKVALPPIPKVGALYTIALMALAMGFYLLLLASLATYGWLVYLLVMWTPDVMRQVAMHPASIRVVVPGLGGAYFALLVFGYATIRGFLVRAGIAPFGIVAHRGHHQKLFTLIREVAEKVEARPLDDIVLVPGTEVGVYEETALYLPPGFGKRKMIIGMATLNTLTLDQMRTVLAHEFGHFSNKDTAYSGFIYRVHGGFGNLIDEMSEVNYYFLNPFYWIFSLYVWIYAHCAASFSRYQEFRSDRFAVNAYGRNQYASAMVAAHLEGSFFSEIGMQEILSTINQRNSGNNIYHEVGIVRRLYALNNESALRKIRGQIMQGPRHALASHPSLGERLKKQNVPTALVQIPELPRMITSPPLAATIPPQIQALSLAGPPSAAEELFGDQILTLQSSLSDIAREEIGFLIHRG